MDSALYGQWSRSWFSASLLRARLYSASLHPHHNFLGCDAKLTGARIFELGITEKDSARSKGSSDPGAGASFEVIFVLHRRAYLSVLELALAHSGASHALDLRNRLFLFGSRTGRLGNNLSELGNRGRLKQPAQGKFHT